MRVAIAIISLFLVQLRPTPADAKTCRQLVQDEFSAAAASVKHIHCTARPSVWKQISICMHFKCIGIYLSDGCRRRVSRSVRVLLEKYCGKVALARSQAQRRRFIISDGMHAGRFRFSDLEQRVILKCANDKLDTLNELISKELLVLGHPWCIRFHLRKTVLFLCSSKFCRLEPNSNPCVALFENVAKELVRQKCRISRFAKSGTSQPDPHKPVVNGFHLSQTQSKEPAPRLILPACRFYAGQQCKRNCEIDDIEVSSYACPSGGKCCRLPSCSKYLDQICKPNCENGMLPVSGYACAAGTMCCRSPPCGLTKGQSCRIQCAEGVSSIEGFSCAQGTLCCTNPACSDVTGQQCRQQCDPDHSPMKSFNCKEGLSCCKKPVCTAERNQHCKPECYGSLESVNEFACPTEQICCKMPECTSVANQDCFYNCPHNGRMATDFSCPMFRKCCNTGSQVRSAPKPSSSSSSSPSPSVRISNSATANATTSVSISASISSSPSASPSGTASISTTTSASSSNSATPSTTPSISTSLSAIASQSSSPSASISASPSASVSVSFSISTSPSSSQTTSASASRTGSLSPSKSSIADNRAFCTSETDQKCFEICPKDTKRSQGFRCDSGKICCKKTPRCRDRGGECKSKCSNGLTLLGQLSCANKLTCCKRESAKCEGPNLICIGMTTECAGQVRKNLVGCDPGFHCCCEEECVNLLGGRCRSSCHSNEFEDYKCKYGGLCCLPKLG